MAQKRNSSKKSSASRSRLQSETTKVIKLGKRTIRALPVTWISLGLNVVLLFTFFTLIGWTHVHSFWFAQRLDRLHRDVCPQVVAPMVDTAKEGGTTVTTFYITDEAVKSGCAQGLIESARLTDYLAHPERAKADADRIRQLSSDNTLYSNQVKSKETGELLAPARN